MSNVLLIFKRLNVVLFSVVIISTFGFISANVDAAKKYSGKDGKSKGAVTPTVKDALCSEESEPDNCDKDKLGLESIRMLHRMLDDDHNGNVDQSESDEFLRDELQYTDNFERQALFHNNDKLISVDDLWKAWKHSIVYNWTVDDVIDWLIQDVDLPQYSHVFHTNAIDGSFLPRLVNSTGILLSALGIRNPVHKQKLSLKAMDTVLFGAPKRIHSYTKDLLLVTSLIIAVGGCWFAYLHHRYSQTQVKRMMKDLESLQKAEEALEKLSNELTEAQKNQKSLAPEKQEEMRMLRQSSLRIRPSHHRHHSGSGDVSPQLSRDNSLMRRQDLEKKLRDTEEEMERLREALAEAEQRLDQVWSDSQWTAPSELQQWLQLSYEQEYKFYVIKQHSAEEQLACAKMECDRIRKRNKAFLGSLRMAHSNSLDDIDNSILQARNALEEVKHDFEERRQRWQMIEMLCAFPIITNPGLAALKVKTNEFMVGMSPGSTTGVGRGTSQPLPPISVEEGDEDMAPSGYQPAIPSQRSFIKQQALAGSTSSLSHATKASVPRRESRDELYQSSHLTVNNPVSFHIVTGDQPSGTLHERTHSSASNTALRPSGNSSVNMPTNNYHNHHTQQHYYTPHTHHTTKNQPAYSHANSYPPFNTKIQITPSPTGMGSHSSSVSTLTNRNGTSSHASSYSNFRSQPSSSNIVSSNISGASSITSNRPSVNYADDSLSSLHSNRPETLSLDSSHAGNQSLNETTESSFIPESPESGETESNSNEHGHNALRPPLDRSPEFDTHSIETDSLHSASALQAKQQTHLKKPSKKKKFVQTFLRKNSSKQKKKF